MHTWTDKNGDVHTFPRIEYQESKRLKEWDVVDLIEHLDPAKTDLLFERLASDSGFVVSMAYALEHKEPGTDEQVEEFAGLLIGGDKGSGPWLECSEALREAVIDFFPEDRRDVIRQLRVLTILETTQQMMARLDLGSEESDSAIHTSGSNGTSDSSVTTAPD